MRVVNLVNFRALACAVSAVLFTTFLSLSFVQSTAVQRSALHVLVD